MIPGMTSTGSKRSAALFGGTGPDLPVRMVRSEGCRIWDEAGREYLDTVMALGAVGLGYAHPAVTEAVETAVRSGVVGPLPPTLEGQLAERLVAVIPGAEAVRFFKTGAEAVAAAVRLARVTTGRDRVLSCGYHGWLDWCQSEPGVPAAVRDLRREIAFNDVAAIDRALNEFGPVAALVIEPLVDDAPRVEWLRALREASRKHGAVLIFDEIKTAFRLAVGGAAERYGVIPDLMVLGKALGNGFPIAAVAGGRAVMDAATRTWISSTLATEMVSLAAAQAVIERYLADAVVAHLARSGKRLRDGFLRLVTRYPRVLTGVHGVPEMCYLSFVTEPLSAAVATRAVARGLIFKRTAYNFVSLAHTDELVDSILERLDAAVGEVERAC